MKESDIHIIFEVLTGSRLYGTNRPDSDYDYKGIAIPPIETFLGNQNFEQLEEKKPRDRTIYALSKFVQLALDCNPNIIELLFAPRKYWVKSTSIWELILQNRDKFLSKKCRYSFLGYAFSQLKRIRTHKHWIDNTPEEPNRKEMGLSLESKIRPDVLEALRTIPTSIIGEHLSQEIQGELKYLTAKKNWDSYKKWKRTRNPARYELESKYAIDTKHALHLVRLIKTGRELLTTGELTVDRREIDAGELLDILHGKLTYEEIVAYAENMEKEFEELYDKSPLPHSPDRKGVEELLINIYYDFFGIDSKKANLAIKNANL